ncbi:MAG: PilZ domain-containing protein [Spirochaetales bacterium]|nr:PilZ domain-containing protein [Spirochaetales bacterium]
MNNSGTERRKESRYETDWPVFLRSADDKRKIGGVSDISLSGIRVMLDDDFSEEKQVAYFDLYLCRTDFPGDLLNISGRVVWSSRSGNTLQMGLELENADDGFRKMLGEYIKEKDYLSLQMDLVIRG